MRDGGIPTQHAYVDIKLTFKEGGAFDFHSSFERIKETLSQAMDVARESGQVTGQAAGVDLSAVNLEQLPAYEEVGGSYAASAPIHIQQPAPITPPHSRQSGAGNSGPTGLILPGSTAGQSFQPPDGPPPGYEEAQQSTVVGHLEESVRRSQ